MMYKWVRELIEKYEFIIKIELKMPHVLIHYIKLPRNDNSEIFIEKIPYRANKDMVIRKIELIKEKIGYYEYIKNIKEKTKTSLATRPIFYFC